MADDYRSADELWREVMKVQVDSFGPTASKKWKLVSRDAKECVHCDEPGGGALIRCSHEKCNKFFHLDCAFHHGGFTLTEQGLLTYECEAHFKHVLFCKCRQKYENTKPMVFCDECCDWYHESCEKLDSDDLASMDRYVCRNCTQTLNAGKAIPQSTKDKNLEKETKSYANQNAVKAVGLLVEIANGSCAIVDSLYGHNEDPLEIAEVESLIEFFNSATFQQRSDSGDDSAKEMEESDFMHQLGVINLVALWKQHATNFLEQWDTWINEVADLCARFVEEHKAVSLDEKQLLAVKKLLASLDSLEKSRSWTANTSDRDLEAYNVFIDCARWVEDFLQVAHQKSKATQWSGQLAAVARNANAKAKKLGSFHMDIICSKFMPYFHVFSERAREASAKMVQWMDKVIKIMNRTQDQDIRLETLEKLAQDAASFPCHPYLYSELMEMVTKGKSLEQAIHSLFHDHSSLQDAEMQILQQLNDQIGELGVLPPSESTLNIVNEGAIYIQAFRMKDERVSMDVATALLEEGRAVSKKIRSLPPPLPALCSALVEEIERSTATLERSMAEARDHVRTSSIGASNLTIEQVYALLPGFHRLSIVVPEEDFLTFLRDALSVVERAADILNHRCSVTMEDLAVTIETATTSLGIEGIDHFPQAQALKIELRSSVAALTALHSEASKYWVPVTSAIADFEKGLGITAELLSDLLQAAAATGVANDEVEAAARQALALGQGKENECLQRLESVIDASDAALAEAGALLEIVHYNAIPKATASKVRQRFETCDVVAQCTKMLSAAEEPADLLQLRECRQKIEKLESHILPDSIEASLLARVRDPFLVFAWKAEVRSIFQSSQSVSMALAEKMLRNATELALGLENSPEWMQLKHSIATAKEVAATATTVLAAAQELMQRVSSGDDDLGILGSEALSDVLASKTFAHLQGESASWLDQAQPILTDVQALVLRCSELVVAKDEETLKVSDTLTDLQCYFSAVSFVMKISSIETMTESFLIPDLKDLTALASKVGALSSQQGPTSLLARIYLLLKASLAEVGLWTERALAMLPLRTSRIRNREDRKGDVVDLARISNSMARKICRTPMHQRLEEVWADIAIFQSKLQKFFHRAIVSQKIVYAEIRRQLPDDLKALAELQSDSNIIPVEIPEFEALQWVHQLFLWLDKVPLPIDDSESDSLSLEEAQRKLRDGAALIHKIPERVIAELVREKILLPSDSSERSNQSFTADAHPAIARSGEILAFLRARIDESTEFQKGVENAIANDFGPSELENLVLTMQTLVVQPDPVVRRLLEKTLAAKRNLAASSNVGVTGRSRKRQSEDMYFWDDDAPLGAATALLQTTAPVVKEQQPKVAKPVKKTKQYQCAASGCNKELRSVQWSGFCSDACAIRSATEMFAALLTYKQHLPADGATLTSELQQRNDLQAFDLADDRGNALVSLSGAPLPAGSASMATSPRDKKPLASLSAAMASLPAVVHTSVLSKDMLDGNGKPKNVLSPKLVHTPSHDQLLRSRARSSWEDFFVQSFSRLQVKGAPILAILLSEELEEAMFHKYTGANGLDVKEYRKHHQMLLPNLRQTHNEALLVKLASGEMSMDHLIGMSAQQLADPSLQLLRQKQLSNVVEDAHRKSTEEVLEEKRRQTMAGTESWRDRDASAGAAPAADEEDRKSRTMEVGDHSKMELSVDTSLAAEPNAEHIPPESPQRLASTPTSASASMAALTAHGHGFGLGVDALAALTTASSTSAPSAITPKGDGSSISSLDGATSRSIEIEDRLQQTSASTKPPSAQAKRPLDVDAGSRFVSNRPKVPRVDTSEPVVESKEPSKAASAAPSDSPRLKAPSLLEILKATKGTSGDSANDDQDDEDDNFSGSNPPRSGGSGGVGKGQVKSSSSGSAGAAGSGSNSSPASYVPTMQLVGKEGGQEFTITRPGGVVMTATGMVSDRRLQGCVKPSFNIDGRTRIKDLDRFVQEVLAANRKIVAGCAFLVFHTGASDSSYNKFCEEFGRDQRAGISNISETLQVYVVPPALKEQVSILSSMKLQVSGSSTGVLYGLMIAKEASTSVHASAMQPTLPFVASSFAVPEKLPYPEHGKQSQAVLGAATASAGGSAANVAGTSSLPAASLPPAAPSMPRATAPPAAGQAAIPPQQIPPSFPRPPFTGPGTMASSGGGGGLLDGPFPMGNAPRTAMPSPMGGFAPPNAFNTAAANPTSMPMPGYSGMPRQMGVPSMGPGPVGYVGGVGVGAGGGGAFAMHNRPMLSQDVMNKIHQVAKFCAEKGVAKLQSLKENPSSRQMMPFLFEGNPGYEEFMQTLKEMVLTKP